MTRLVHSRTMNATTPGFVKTAPDQQDHHPGKTLKAFKTNVV
jgi:hypothetical protein